jgi:hypothetical protein
MVTVAHDQAPAAGNTSPRTPEELKDAAISSIINGAEELLAIKKEGSLPRGVIVHLEGLQIDPEASLEERLQATDANAGLFYDAIQEGRRQINPKAFKKHVIYAKPPEHHTVDWEPREGEPARTVFYRLGPHMAFMDNYMKNGDDEPIRTSPELWFGRDLINVFLEDNAPELLEGPRIQTVAFR